MVDAGYASEVRLVPFVDSFPIDELLLMAAFTALLPDTEARKPWDL